MWKSLVKTLGNLNVYIISICSLKKKIELSIYQKSCKVCMYTIFSICCNIHQVWWFLLVRIWLYFLQVFSSRKGCISICWKSPLNQNDSKSTVVIGVVVKSKNLCASLLLLEDRRRCLGVMIVQRFNNRENLSWGVWGLDIPV